MSYYRGDYYRGDYYRGSIFSKIGKAIGKVAKTAVGLLPGPVGAIARTATSTPRAQLTLGPGPGLPGLPTIGFGPATGGTMMVPKRAGGFGGSRRMNVTNVKALRRAGRRVRGFLKLARKLGALPVNQKGKKLFKRTVRRKK